MTGRWFGWLGLALAAAAGAQESGEVRGSVADARGGEALAKVAVELVGGPYRAASDGQGRFAFASVAPGDYILNVSTVGYRLIKKPFHLEAGETKEFEVALSADTLARTDEVEVAAGPFEAGRDDGPPALELSGNDAKNLASVLADDPLRAVQSLPGVTSNDDYDARFSLRGADYSRIGLYFDGVLLHMPFHTVEGTPDTGSAAAFNGDMVEELELHEGAWPARYADRTAGVLDVEERDGAGDAASFRVAASASNAGGMAEGPIGKHRRGSWLVTARKSYLQYILERTASNLSIDFALDDVQGRLNYALTPRLAVALDTIESYSSLDRSSAKNQLGINSLMEAGYHYTFTNLTLRYTPAEHVTVVSHAAWMREKFDDSNPTALPLSGGHYGEWVWNGEAAWMWGAGGQLDAGWTLRRLRDSGFANQYYSGPPHVALLDQDDGTGLRGGFYAQQSWTLARGAVKLNAGARWDRDSVDGVGAGAPSASASFAPARRTRVVLAWGQYVQFPELADLRSPLGGPGLLPTRANHALGSVEQRIGERVRLRAEFYERDDRDLTERPFYDPRILNGAIFTPPLNPPERNSGRGYARGFELVAERRSANRLNGWVSYAYGVARERDGVEHTAYPSDYDQRHTVNVFASYRIRPSVNLSARWMYGSGFPIPGFLRLQNGQYYLAGARNQLRFGAYQRVDWRINKSWTKDRYKMTLYGEVVNLTDHANFRFDSFNSFNSKTGLVSLTIDKLFPVLPSAGIVFEW
ncbi:MAG TPA: TonB-dependent receptor [Bryobacteraceae bacterium]|nr:TonB-dependent receptor [Bryobacteraceae bacterium]